MKSPLVHCRRALLVAAVSFAAMPLSVRADDITPPVVVNALPDLTVPLGTGQSVVKLKDTFTLSGVTGQVVRFETVLGNIDVELDATDYPLNVANFLTYTNGGSYDGTFIHRTVPGFIFQGGGYRVTGNLQYPHIDVNAAVKGEHKANNVRGTIAFALLPGTSSADSGTSEWFFNLADNTSLDDGSNSQGPFTAFGRVIEGGLATMDTIAAVPYYDASTVVLSADRSVFSALPLINYTSAQQVDIDPDLVYINKVSEIPMVPAATGTPSLLTFRVTNSNPDLVTVTLKARKLKLAYAAGKTGTAKIKVVATDSAGTPVKAKFKVTVQ